MKRFTCQPLLLATLLVTCFTMSTTAQTNDKRALDHDAYDEWKSIEDRLISNDGRWVAYVLAPGAGDPELYLYDAASRDQRCFARADNPSISADNRFLVFEIHPPDDSLRAMKRRKVKKNELPGDTLGIYDLSSGVLEKVPNLKTFRLPEKWNNWLAYAVEPDSLRQAKKKKKGLPLLIRDLTSGTEQTLMGVDDFELAEEGAAMLLTSTGADSAFAEGVYHYDFGDRRLQALLRTPGAYKQLSMDKEGRQVAFLADFDTTKATVGSYELFYWSEGRDSARLIADSRAAFLPAEWMISENGSLQFSEDGRRLFFGTAPQPLTQDTSLLDDEIVNVEVWSYTDGRLYTQQEDALEEDKKRSYRGVWLIPENKFFQLADQTLPQIRPGNEGKADVVLGIDDEPYQQLVSWAGYPSCKDVYLIDVKTGRRKMIAERVCGNPALSPLARYVYWYSSPDSAWFAYSITEERLRQVTSDETGPFYDELNDRPEYPSDYGMAGWTTEDEFMILYDRYDMWLIDPKGNMVPNNMTKGRDDRRRYRYVRLDREERAIEEVGRILLHYFDEATKEEGYTWYNIHTGFDSNLTGGDYSYSSRVLKAKDAERYVFTREDFQSFLDLLYSKDLKTFERISSANPQQSEYRWGSVEMVNWTSLSGEPLTGLLYKPEDFDPGKQYPMMVYFYERYSDRLHNYVEPAPSRSIINFSFYVSRGYLIFVPDIPYRVGYPGESAFNAVMPGVTALMEKGFVDRDRIGVQGHSWGGYQVAYLITETDLFRCAESGAPVVNMFSAYGGIRWGSGMSRMFQYERTQSRIGGTIWDYPMRYYENSPIFFADKINTPVLILHNDEDTAVPWYQGIEFFVALRRLGKPAWLLNYNGDPHWVMKKQNRKDFTRRMQQFFDYYLMDAPKPQWMAKGVPAIAKGIEQGLEPVESEGDEKVSGKRDEDKE